MSVSPSGSPKNSIRFDLKWGERICHLYNTKEELLEVLVPYFADGLRSHECCVWITSEGLTVEEAREALSRSVPELNRFEESQQLMILAPDQEHLTVKSPQKRLKKLLCAMVARVETARSRGFDGLRVTGNLYFDDTREGWQDFIDYEQQINASLGAQRVKSLCSYRTDAAKGPAELAEILGAHTGALVKKGSSWKWIRSQEHDMLDAVRVQKEKLRILALELERSNSELAQFAYIASHDLQEPLRTITYFSELLHAQLDDKLDVESKHYLTSIADSSMRARKQVEVLLDFARLEKAEKTLGVVDCEAVMNKATANLAALIVQTRAKIITSPLPSVVGEKYLLVQLFQNLIANALKFRSKNDAPLIEITASREKEKWVIAVKDNGIGIGRDHHERIFQLFQRLHSRDDYPGMGIGLALCKKIVERHNGRIWVESDSGRGAVFYVSLSVVHDSPAEFFEKESALLIQTASDWKSDFSRNTGKQHLVHFADSLHSLVSTVEIFSAAGLRLGEAVLFAAIPAHAEAFRSHMRAKDIPLDEAEKEGRMVFLDAEELLAGFYGPQGLTYEAFRAVVTKVLDETQTRGFPRVRIYGEIVHLLWSRGEPEIAVKLEEFWNRLSRERKFLLFCGYIINDLPTDNHSSSFLEVCGSHQKMIIPDRFRAV